MKPVLLAGLVSLLLTQASAFAYDYAADDSINSNLQKLYVGANIGLVAGDAQDFCDERDLTCLPWKALVGYRVNEKIAVEGSLFRTLKGTSSASADYGEPYDTGGMSASVLGFYPIQDNIEAFGRLGVAVWDTESDNSVTVANICNGGTDFLIGGGAQMNISDNLGLRGEMEYIGGDFDSTTFSAGITYSTF
ncbi:MAG: outer membrane beta-barrel protein [Thiothrix sp.]|nr:outer membrane beta-barrel protein [Thiothrix sp.]